MSYRTHRGYMIPSTGDATADEKLVELCEARATLWVWYDAWMQTHSDTSLCEDKASDAALAKLHDTVRVCTGSEEPHNENAVGVHVVKRPMYSRECEPRSLDYFLTLHAV